MLPVTHSLSFDAKVRRRIRDIERASSRPKVASRWPAPATLALASCSRFHALLAFG